MKKNREPGKNNRLRLLILFMVIALGFSVLAVRLGDHMIVHADEYAARAVAQQTSDSIVAANRGEILDRNGNQLAICATSNTIWIRPESIRNNGKTDEEAEKNFQLAVDSLSEILGLDSEYVRETAMSEKKLIKLTKNVDNDTADRLRAEKLRGVEIVESAKRYYPLGAFASQILGSTNDDNQGLMGVELFYDRYLSGIDGRWITSKDSLSNSNTLVYGTDKYYSAEDGYSIVLTIDENIQYIVEQKIQEAREASNADRVICMMMDPKTGEILAMAETDEYDPNDPRTPVSEEDKEAFQTMTDEDKVKYWNKLWRNFCVSETYEPGSTFKPITTAIALEAGVTHLGDEFYCNGTYQVADWLLKCWYYPRAHGKETLEQAVGNSCNPVMIQLVQRLGLTKYYDGLDAFGLTSKTGIDYPGEASNILQDRNSAGPVGLATMSYGQGIAVTPVSLVTAIASLANGGKIMQPHFVKELRDADGNVVQKIEPQVRSFSVSEQTCREVMTIMEYVVAEGGGGTAKIPGYRIGGKTGTANKPDSTGGYAARDVYASFIGIAPLEDPKFTILLIVDSPKGVLYGSSTAAPYAKMVMESVLAYMGIEPQYSEAELESIKRSEVTVPDLSGHSMEDAIGILGGKELGYIITPAVEYYNNLVVTDQYPRPGTTLKKGDKVTLYYEPGATELQTHIEPTENEE